MRLSLVGHLLSAPLAFALSWVLLPQFLTIWAVVFLPLAGLGIPFTAAFAWLMARGSNWTNTRFAALVLVLTPIRLYLTAVALFAGVALYGALSSLTTLTRPATMGVSIASMVLISWGTSRVVAQRWAKAILKWCAPELCDTATPTLTGIQPDRPGP